MTGLHLCRIRPAGEPFYISAASLNVWTAEELSYFIATYSALADESLATPALTRWVSGELGLYDTALKMEQALRAGGSLAAFFTPFLRSADYLTDKEIRTCTARISELEVRTPGEKLRRKADALFDLHRYEQAMRLYEKADAACGTWEKDLRSAIWRGCGAAAMQMLEYEKGCAAFRRAYDAKNSRENLLSLLTALRVTRPSEKYAAEAKELGADDETLARIDAKIQKARPVEMKIPADIDAYLEEQRKAYHIWAGT